MNQYDKFIIQIKELIGSENIENDVPMKNHTTFKVGGNSDIMVTPETYEQVRDIIKLCKNSGISYFVMGKGSNILVKDGGIRGVVIKLTKLDKIQIDNDIVIAQAGVSLISLSLKTAKNSLTGLEFASGIPGSVGGAVVMNAGAYGGDISKIIVSAVVIDNNLNIVKINRSELELSYRDSMILKKGYVVLEAVFKLEKSNIDEINSTISDLTRRRKEKQPLEYASAGSTFKRPEGYYAGKLIQDSGLKGYSIGDAEVSEKHSGFIINKGNASATDLLNLISYVQKRVYKKFNVKLETEVKIVGED